MNIMMVNKFYFQFGGAERVMFSLSDYLTRSGHTIVPFATTDPRNKTSVHSANFAPHVSLRSTSSSVVQQGVAALRLIRSRAAAAQLNKLLDSIPRIDVAHLHNINYELTPAILRPLVKRGIPIVWTLHDFQLICPNHLLYDQGTCEICEDCITGRFYRAPMRGCIQGSRLKSLLGATEAYVNRWVGTYQRHISLFIAPSQFLANKVIEMGAPIRQDRLLHIPNGVDLQKFTPSAENDGYVLFVGRLSSEKGVDVLLEALRLVSGCKAVIVGTGPVEAKARAFVSAHGLADRVRFAGHLDGEELTKVIQRACAMVVPSVWYENCPMTILEAFASGTPVIASAIGGIPELLKHTETGFLVPPGDSQSLAEAIRGVVDWPDDAKKMGVAARKRAEEDYDWNGITQKTTAAYELAIARRG